ncbi:MULTISPECIES: sugar phosphate isomerase/epimerase family protein [Paenibacillus]|uniref:sugar phosphate isomerase/epimerase family protein n=1 Tax=Paenibacillus TaxID=44249 RepID=UPI002FE02FAD
MSGDDKASERNSRIAPGLKFSLCSTGLKGETLENVLNLAADIGLQGVELWTGHIQSYLERGGSSGQLRGLLEQRGLRVPAISEYTYFSKGAEETSGELRRIQSAAVWARELGCPRIRSFAGHRPSRSTLAEEWDAVVSGLTEAVKICSSEGVRLAVEIHNHTLADTSESLAVLVRDVPAPGIELIYDGFNLFVDHLDPIPVLERFFTDIGHVHFKDYHWDHQDWSRSVPVPILQGDADHKAILRKLLELGYNGFISFEYMGNPEQVVSNTKRSLAEIRHFANEQQPELNG